MRIQHKLLLMAVLSVSTSWAYADICEDDTFTDAILKQAHLQNIPGHLADCKRLPQQADRAVLLYQRAFNTEDSPEQPVSYQINLLTVDTQRVRLIDHYIDSDEYVTDAIVLDSMWLDTAAYQLNPKLRAIGVRVYYHGSSQVNPYSYTLLNLYDLEKKKKRLNNLRVSLSKGSNDGRCNAEDHDRGSTVVILNTQHNGMADLRINTKETNEVFRWVNEECIQADYNESKRSHSLKFNGQNYVIPRYLQEYAE